MENTAVKTAPASKKVNLSMKQYGMVLALIAVYLIFAALTGGKNLSAINVNNLIMQNGYVIILAVGMLLCVLTGNVDLGVGSVVASCGAVAGTLIVDFGVSTPVAMLAALAVGALFGVFVGFFVSKLAIPPFIVTLATMLMGRGICYVILQSQTKGPLPADYNWISTGFLPTIKVGAVDGASGVDLVSIAIAIVVAVLIVLAEIKNIATTKKHGLPMVPTWQLIIKDAVIIGIEFFFFYKLACFSGVPVLLILLAIVVGIYHFITTQTVAGRQIYAMGGNAKAARLSGINTEKVFFWVYANMGLLCGVAGIVLSARNASATPKAGDQFEMDAIASCYIGGAATSGGVGTIIGAVVGALIMGVLNNGMSLAGFDTNVQKIVKGAVLLGAVTIDLLSKRKKG
ncbi:ABC transporter permease [Flavonifractor sp. An92]|uniref:multiple monosaccharide ABC transporter permease n=1 Tax=Flavonifractor sp. An92 TaxID=1965666 RepID=UPI000B374CE0|nr:MULTISPECIES: multiple monosaccharide ABC transporter permease [unclassified Flavonifractor]OUN08191.1 ABC transporter permease [Flavonifractor sp. An92]OUQ18313.1 ABC transporter permease [Flavonifractor sp. An135]